MEHVQRRFVVPLRGRVVGQVLASGGLFYASTTAGEVAAFTADGYIAWRTDVGELAHACAQLDGYGIVGSGVIDERSSRLFVADAFGRLHALDLRTGAERAGWPVRLFADFRRQLNWGALTIADGAVYVPTAAYCDVTSPGGVYRVDLTTRAVTSWLAVSLAHGGGGGPWGWGGITFDSEENALYVATSGALVGGDNTGDSFTETIDYGQRLVRLATDLAVVASSHPSDLPDRQDLDFVGSPVVVDRPGCGKLIVATTKNAVVYAWRADAIASGPIWQLRLETYDPRNPMLANLAWSSDTASIYAVTGTQFVRVAVGRDCGRTVIWRKALATNTENGSPTIAGDTVWFAVNGPARMYGYDATTGRRIFSAPLGGTTLEAPTIVNGRLVVGTMTGLVQGFAFAAANTPAVAPAPTSWAEKGVGWQSRADGVWSTDDGGQSWTRIFGRPVLHALRLSSSSGLISVAGNPGSCMCTTQQYWTDTNGGTWHRTTTLPEDFAAGGGRIYMWTKTSLATLASELRSTTSARLASEPLATIKDGTIRDVQPTADGVVALVSNRVSGQRWDNAPRVLVVDGMSVKTIRLPSREGEPLVQRLRVSGETVTVTATDFSADKPRLVIWRSSDGGSTWISP